MEVVVKAGKISEMPSEAMVLTFFEGEERLSGAAGILDEVCGGIIRRMIREKDFEGRLNQISMIYPGEEAPIKRVLLLGLGVQTAFDLEKLRGAFAKAALHLRNINMKVLTSFVDFQKWSGNRFPLSELVEATVEGVHLGLYQFTPFKTVERDKIKELNTLVLVEEEEEKLPVVLEAARKAEKIARAVYFARDLVSSPGNVMTPNALAEKALEMASTRQKIKTTILDKGQMEELGMHALLAVARGSDEPPRFIILSYEGQENSDEKIVLVGKGITFDSGGISLKPSENMGEMKSDMAGAAAVIATVQAAADLDLPVNIVGLVPATENIPGGCAYKPGDVLKSLSGQTIEVISTDAEGRLILADALTYAGRYRPQAIVDVATLTGACVIALGKIAIGMFGKDSSLKEELVAAGQSTGEKVWEMPLWDDYFELIKSDIADYKNTGGRYGGAITAAAFLSKFVGEYPWVHLDIAGPAWLDKDRPYIPKGASGIGVRLLISWLRSRTGTA
ncbi:MAG: Cytosol aminopeptidase [Syntrophus sp. PtaU1.Bin208]|nr:MAG: Cytosol aminopeptidase [Syntrophus sp. PtaU1.Bin208]